MPIKRLVLVVITLIALVAVGVVYAPRSTPAEEPARVGMIQIKGNTKTPDKDILSLISLVPGQVLTYPDLKQAEKKLKSVNGTITVLDPGTGSNVRDLLIEVQEK